MSRNETVEAGGLELSELRKRLEGTRGKEYWRSLDQIADTGEFRNFLNREFPSQASEWLNTLSRRRFMKVMGASLAFAGLAACGRPTEKIVPYVRQPENLVPGRPLFYATAMSLAGQTLGLLVESHEGRPTKIEGNPNHPTSLGATDAYAQASILTMYDPDRSQVPMFRGQIRSYSDFTGALISALQSGGGSGGAGLRILTETVVSPTMGAQLAAIQKAYPNSRWYQYEPAAADNTREGSRMAFGSDADTAYDFSEADVVLALDSDFLAIMPNSVRYSREFMDRRRLTGGNTTMSRLYVAESTPTPTGAKADHRLPIRASEIDGLLRAIAARVGVQVAQGSASQDPARARWIEAVAADLVAHRGASIVLVGEGQPAAVHALAHAVNAALGNAGKTVLYMDAAEIRPTNQLAELRQLASEMDAGRVTTLLVLGGNPVYTAPADLNFAGKLAKVPFTVHQGLYFDETAAECQWHVPETHFLENWSDARAFDGTESIVQPLIAPLYQGHSIHEVLAIVAGQPGQTAHDVVKSYRQSQMKTGSFEAAWRQMLHDGVIPGTARKPRAVAVRPQLLSELGQPAAPAQGLELVLRPDPTIFDGRFANNGWLQELPKPLTKLTWDNAALLSPALAEQSGVATGDMVELKYQGGSLQVPVWVMPGHAPNSVTLYLGYGRPRGGRVAEGHGFNAYLLRTSTNPHFGGGLQISKTSGRYQLATTQDHQTLDGRNIVRAATLDEYHSNPKFAREGEHDVLPSLYPDYEYQGYAWGMAIDQNACIGCSACVVACVSENNIPVVGKQQVLNAREMHWLRIDTYYSGNLDNPATYFQPMLCQQCERAPCEVVCPVAATVHSNEGLNDMVYNRCVGTRYCSNNCPWKVRRFNFLQFSDKTTESYKLMRNPDVTVRERGVMEKCTYCVQRINAARINAEREGRAILPDEIQTACQAACPTNAIVFGNINDPNSTVSKLRAEPRTYFVLGELNTVPRTSYMAFVHNTNRQLEVG